MLAGRAGTVVFRYVKQSSINECRELTAVGADRHSGIFIIPVPTSDGRKTCLCRRIEGIIFDRVAR